MKQIKLPKQLVALGARGKKLLKHHYFIFTLLLLCGLVWAVYVVNETLSAPTDESYRVQKISESIDANFDKATIEKIEALQKSNEQSAGLPAPTGARTNPFAE